MLDPTIFAETRPRPSIALPFQTTLQGRFVIGRLLGRPGGFGITYLALDSRLNRAVALKEFFPRALAARDADGITVLPQTSDEAQPLDFGRDRFLDEARTLARFDHPGIVRVQDFFEANGTAYLIMPFYLGQTLEDYLREQPRNCVDESTAVALMLPVLDALTVVHGAGLLHRDLKPDNIYLRHPTGQPTLLDFGSAQAETAQRSRTVERALTPGYAAVEQYLTEGEQRPYTDLYACGATLYRMLSGRVPIEALSRIGKVDPLFPIGVVAPGVNEEFARIVTWALQPQATERVQTARDLQSALQRFENASASATPVSTPVRPEPVPHSAEPAYGVESVRMDAPRPPAVESASGNVSGGSPGPRSGLRAKLRWTAGIAALLVAVQATVLLGVSVSGTVQDEAGTPLSDAVVQLSAERGSRTATTDANGTFKFRWLRPGRQYTLQASLPGYLLTANDRSEYSESFTSDPLLSFIARTPEQAYRYFAIAGDSLVRQGISQRETYNVDYGLTLLDEAVKFFPDSISNRAERLRGRWFKGDYAGCLEDNAVNPQDFAYWCELGAGNYDAAYTGFTTLARRSSSSADPQIGLAITRERQGNTAEALTYFTRAAQLAPIFAFGRERVQADGSYYYNEDEWQTIEQIATRYRETTRNNALQQFTSAFRDNTEETATIGDVLLSDDFATNWQWNTSDTPDADYIQVRDGALYMMQRRLGYTLAAYTPNPLTHGDFIARWHMVQVNGDSDGEAGLAFRSDADSEYRLGIRGNGYFTLYRMEGGNATYLASWTSIPAMYRMSDWITVEVRVIGGSLTLFVDGDLVQTVSGIAKPTGSYVGFYVDPERLFAFDNVVMMSAQ